MCADMCADMCAGMCADMCADMCIEPAPLVEHCQCCVCSNMSHPTARWSSCMPGYDPESICVTLTCVQSGALEQKKQPAGQVGSISTAGPEYPSSAARSSSTSGFNAFNAAKQRASSKIFTRPSGQSLPRCKLTALESPCVPFS